MKTSKSTSEINKTIMVIFGAALYSLGITFFITPHNLYSGGVMGLSQLLRSLVVMLFNLSLPSGFDLSGIIYYLLNIPLFIIAYREISRKFFVKTIIAATTITVLTSVVPVPEAIVANELTSCIVGGLITGIGVGFMLRYGGSGGGLDIVGMFITKKSKDASVGKVSLIFNIVLYLICAILFNIEIAVYSIIFTAVSSLALDKTHYQNIMIRVMIFTKKDGVAQPIMEQLGRGVTEWNGSGAYTHEEEHILVTLISKYEMNTVRRLVQEIDPQAFIIYDHVTGVDGNFLKKL